MSTKPCSLTLSRRSVGQLSLVHRLPPALIIISAGDIVEVQIPPATTTTNQTQPTGMFQVSDNSVAAKLFSFKQTTNIEALLSLPSHLPVMRKMR